MKPEFRVSARVARPPSEVFDAVVNPSKLSGYFTTVGGECSTSRRRYGSVVGQDSSRGQRGRAV